MGKISDFLTKDIELKNLLLPIMEIRAGGCTSYESLGPGSGSYTYGNVGTGGGNYYAYSCGTSQTYTPTIYSKSGYTCYYATYGNYCKTHCQICNTCQTKCQVNQYIYYWLNKEFKYDETDLLFILANDINDLIDYIEDAKDLVNGYLNKYSIKDGKINVAVDDDKVSVNNIYYHETFNVINDAIKSFINGATNIGTKDIGNTILKDNMETLKTKLNQIKIPTTIPCCQTNKHESCASRQD